MEIREIEEKDNKAVESIIKRSLESFHLDIPGTAYTDPQLGSLAQYYATERNSRYWVAVNERGEVMGGVGIGQFDEKERICELQKLYIKPEAQGQGLSRELMEVALKFAKVHYTACYLETSTKLRVANILYEKLGFELLNEPIKGSDHNEMDAWYIKEL